MHYLLLVVLVFSIDLVPAFAPPAWIVAVFFKQRYNLEFALVVLLTALATAAGRLLLAQLTRKLKRRLPKRYIASLAYSQELLSKNKRKSGLAIGLFLFSPLPSAQLFEAAGLLDVALLPLAAAFFFGRLVTLSLYLLFAHLTITSFSKLLENGVTTIWAVVFEVLCIMVIIAMLKMRSIVKWFKARKQKKTRKSA